MIVTGSVDYQGKNKGLKIKISMHIQIFIFKLEKFIVHTVNLRTLWWQDNLSSKDKPSGQFLVYFYIFTPLMRGQLSFKDKVIWQNSCPEKRGFTVQFNVWWETTWQVVFHGRFHSWNTCIFKKLYFKVR